MFFRSLYLVNWRWADMIAFSALTGARFGEVSAMTVGQVNVKGQVVMLDRRFSRAKLERGTKGSNDNDDKPRTREARIPSCAWAILYDHCEGKRRDERVFDGPEGSFNKRWVASMDNQRWRELDAILDKLVDAKGNSMNRNFRHHNMRHSLLTFLKDNKIPDHSRKVIAGHSDRTMTDGYTRMTEDAWKEVVAALQPLAELVCEIRPAALEYWKRRRADALAA